MDKKLAIISGVTGQDGAYLSQFLLEKNYQVIGLIFSPKYCEMFNLEYLKIKDKIIFEECNLLDSSQVSGIIAKYLPSEIYHLAAQSSVGLSFDNPLSTFIFNSTSSLNFLEAVRTVSPKSKLLNPSSGEIYGKPKKLPITEEAEFEPINPYAISKLTSHMLADCFKNSYKLFVCNAILFNHESYLRPKNFFIKKIIQQSIEIKYGDRESIRVGNIEVKRDFGFAPAYVEAMWLMLQNDQPENFIISSGKSVSLKEIVDYVFGKLKIDKRHLIVDKTLYRPNDVLEFYGDSSKIKKSLGWNYNKSFFEVLDLLIKEEIYNMEGKCEKEL